jgi:hypothetical protein
LDVLDDTAEHFSQSFRGALFAFHGYASALCSQLPTIDDEEQLQRLRYQVRMRRDLLSEAAQGELAAALPAPAPLSLVLSHLHENEGTYFVVKLKNETEAEIVNWAVQLEIPPSLVNDATDGSYIKSESDKMRAVFRTTQQAVQMHPLWHGASYTFKVKYELNETNQGARTFNVRATAYVDSRLVAEQIKGIDDLSTYFAPAVVARRKAHAALMLSATQLGDAVVQRLRRK